jgi:hypothetical protein
MNHHRLLLDVDVISRLVELADTHNILYEPHDIVYTGEQPVLPILAQEECGPAPLDLGHGVIAKANYPAHCRVQICERRPGARHVICSPRVTDPKLGISLLLRPELDEDLFFMQMHQDLKLDICR